MYKVISSFFILLLIMFIFIIKYKKVMMSINMMNMIKMNFNLMMTNKEIYFSITILLISLMVIMYSKFYFHYNLGFNYLVNLLLFVMSMIILVNSKSLLMMIIGWDGLGISSFFLISMYSNSESMISSLITFFFNRLGDSLMVSFYSLFLMETNDIKLMFFNLFTMVMLFFSLVTKSAQLPFGIWLPMAMAAPTPISSLVHSSTLVVSGIFIMMKIPTLFAFTELKILLIFFGLLTFFFSGFFSFFIMDLKKAVAFSTLSQLGMIIFSLSLGNINISFSHLIMHAMFKSCLFINLGFFMMFNISMQDFRMKYFLSLNKFSKLSFIFCCINLMGLMFTCGFLSKDLMLLSYINNNIKVFILLLLYLGCIMTVCYSLKFILISFSKSLINMSMKIKMMMNLFFFGTFILSLICMFIPLYMMEIFFFEQNYFISIKIKPLLFFLFMFSILKIKFLLMKFKKMNFFLSSMMFMLENLNENLFYIMKKNFKKINLFLMTEENYQMIILNKIFLYSWNKLFFVKMSLFSLFFSNIILFICFSMNFH